MVKFEGYTVIERDSAAQRTQSSVQILILWLLLLSNSDTGKSANTNPTREFLSRNIAKG